LRIIETPHSAVGQKEAVITFLGRICRDPETLIDLFIEYDCDLKSNDIFERMANDLSKIAQGTSSPHTWESPTQEIALKTSALDCLVSILSSLSSLCKEEEELQSTNTNGEEAHSTHSTPSVSPGPTSFSPSTPMRNSSSSPGSLTPSLSTTPSLDPQDAENLQLLRKQKQHKMILEEGRARFSADPKKSLEFFEANHLLVNTPEGIAKFFHETDGLDKNALGEFIGGSKPLNKQVLKEYVHMCNFSGKEIDEALRQFLAQFRLPGEGPVIDRFMEHFGARFFEDNPDSRFPDADAVYKIAFGIMMLATDLHNPNVKSKLTEADWLRMINTYLKMNMEEDYLLQIYKRVGAQRFELNNNLQPGKTNIADLLNPKQRQMVFMKETTQWVDASMKKLQEASSSGSPENEKRKGVSGIAAILQSVSPSTRNIECARQMFELVWAASLASCSLLLESSDDPRVLELCQLGFRRGIHIACFFSHPRLKTQTALGEEHLLVIQRSAFVTTLAKFTNVNSLREMKQKHLQSVRTMVQVAQEEGNDLGDSWTHILRCTSLLQRLNLLATPAQNMPEETHTSATMSPSSSQAKRIPFHLKAALPLISAFKFSQSDILLPSSHQQSFEAQNSKLVLADFDNSLIDKLFTDTDKLSNSAILDFVKSLCEVARGEIVESASTAVHGYRTFSLQKLVEVAHFNMDRMRLVWSEIWGYLCQIFTEAGCHTNHSVSMFAIDSLRQLAFKFLEKDELANFNFQKEFFRPFEFIVAARTSADSCEMVIQCLLKMIQTRSNNIKSGWKSIFTILSMTADDQESLQSLSFEVLSETVKEHYDEVTQSGNAFIETVNCLIVFTTKTNQNINLRAVALLHQCASNLCAGKPKLLDTSDQPRKDSEPKKDSYAGSEGHLFTDSNLHLSVWFPVLTGISGVIGHPNSEVRGRFLSFFLP